MFEVYFQITTSVRVHQRWLLFEFIQPLLSQDGLYYLEISFIKVVDKNEEEGWINDQLKHNIRFCLKPLLWFCPFTSVFPQISGIIMLLICFMEVYVGEEMRL